MRRRRVSTGPAATILATSVSCLCLLHAGCSMTRLAAKQTTAIILRAMPALERESDLELAEQAILSNMKTLEGLLEIIPDNPDLLLLTSRTFTGYTFGFLEEEIAEADRDYNYEEKERLMNRAIDFYLRGRKYGLQLLARYGKDFDQISAWNSKELTEKLKNLDKDQVPGLFWTAYAWGSLILLQQDEPKRIAELPLVNTMMMRVLELDEEYFFGGAHLFYAGYFGSRPRTLGGDPEKARQHLTKAIELTGGKYLMARFLLAKFYAIQAQNRLLFTTTLEEILETPGDVFPEQTLANTLAKRKAALWLARVDEIFL